MQKGGLQHSPFCSLHLGLLKQIKAHTADQSLLAKQQNKRNRQPLDTSRTQLHAASSSTSYCSVAHQQQVLNLLTTTQAWKQILHGLSLPHTSDHKYNTAPWHQTKLVFSAASSRFLWFQLHKVHNKSGEASSSKHTEGFVFCLPANFHYPYGLIQT